MGTSHNHFAETCRRRLIGHDPVDLIEVDRQLTREFPTEHRRFRTCCRADEHVASEVLFQIPDVRRHRRLRESAPRRGFAERSRAEDVEKRSELIERRTAGGRHPTIIPRLPESASAPPPEETGPRT